MVQKLSLMRRWLWVYGNLFTLVLLVWFSVVVTYKMSMNGCHILKSLSMLTATPKLRQKKLFWKPMGKAVC